MLNGLSVAEFLFGFGERPRYRKQYREERQKRLEELVRLDAQEIFHQRIKNHRDNAQNRKADYDSPQSTFGRHVRFEVDKSLLQKPAQEKRQSEAQRVEGVRTSFERVND